jgi:hypothetical protein
MVIHIPLSEALREKQVHRGPELHATLRCVAVLMGNDGQILPIYSFQQGLENDFFIFAPDLRILSATLPLHP